MPVDDIVTMLMSDYGVELYGNVIMVNPTFAKEKPEAVKGFVKALVKGLKDTVADPSSATDPSSSATTWRRRTSSSSG